MKNLLLLIFLMCSAFSLSAQTKDNPLIIKYTSNWEPIKKGSPVFIGKAWPENGKWRRQDYYADINSICADGWYKDAGFTIKDGPFLQYYRNGKLESTTLFSSDKKQGLSESFYISGKKSASLHYTNDILTDSGFYWYENGRYFIEFYADSLGNGEMKSYYENGGTKLSGPLSAGMQHGKWFAYDESGKKLMALNFIKDSLVTLSCLDGNGFPVAGTCIFEKPAEITGGAAGWRKFLEKNLKYPEEAQMKNIQGVVKVSFLVSESGDISDVNILSSPSEFLSKEVIRLFSVSPPWKPAISLNKPVPYRHIQSVTFRLE